METYHKEYPFNFMLKQLRQRSLFSISHALVLLDLKSGPKIQQHIAESTNTQPPNVLGILNSLLDSNLIKRDPDTLAWSLDDEGLNIILPVVSHTPTQNHEINKFPGGILEWDPDDEPESGRRALNGVFLTPNGKTWAMQLNCGCETSISLSRLRSLMALPDSSEARKLECQNMCKIGAGMSAEFWAPAAFHHLP